LLEKDEKSAMVDNQDNANEPDSQNQSKMPSKDALNKKQEKSHENHQKNSRDVFEHDPNLPHGIDIIDVFRSSHETFPSCGLIKKPFADEADPLFEAYKNLLKANNSHKTILDKPPSATNLIPRIFVSHSHTDNEENRQRKRVFISYSHEDEDHLKRLHVHLTPYEREGLFEVWDNKKIEPGAKWQEEMTKALESTKVAVLLVSGDFLASDFIYKNELPPLLEAANKRGARILSVILSHCDFDNSLLAQFRPLNNPDRPLTAMNKNEKEKIWKEVAGYVKEFVRKADS
jgi:hypothetical protein